MKIAVLTSGGVDSSVALRLLKDQGHEVTAFYLKIWLEDELAYLGDCPWEEDLAFVRSICEKNQIPLEVVPFQKEYWKRVVEETIKEVEAGRTPNPDMLCNARIKFGAFLEYLSQNKKEFPFDKIASGHYAQTEEREGITLLKQAPDDIKDQTYFLSQLSQEQLSQIIFPIGQYTKSEVRSLAKQFKLANAERKDSQGICFLGKIPFDQFLEAHLGKRPGNLIEKDSGQILGKHNGFWFYTIGQRRGIRLPGGPWYVVAKNSEKNQVFISHGKMYQAVARDTFLVKNINWFSGAPSEKEVLQVKIRHGAKMYQAKMRKKADDLWEVVLIEKDQGIASGQYAVFYDGVYCLGGGAIV